MPCATGRDCPDQHPAAKPVTGHAGDAVPVGNGVNELRVHHGPGYRVYFLREAKTVVMLCGGDKDTQQRDIERAGKLARDWRQR